MYPEDVRLFVSSSCSCCTSTEQWSSFCFLDGGFVTMTLPCSEDAPVFLFDRAHVGLVDGCSCVGDE